ncbi:hypothetical protein QVD17_42066 [Tagetes erecta]|uniref:Uncharacterized protein n=1 Tax=Tagetes erecta TaxID=13708 RepID=A0AAD8NG11_TARER|nr:hypothetical protein QVD17_42066 [Tagetes erecta]
MRVQNCDFTDTGARQNYAEMIQVRDDPHNRLSEDQIMQVVLGERRVGTQGVGKKLSQYAFAHDSSSSSSRIYTMEDVLRVMVEYIAPLGWKLNMSRPPSFNEEDDEDGDDDEDE